MNVYIYGALDRNTIDKKVIEEGDDLVKTYTEYSVSTDSNLLIVAFPNKEVNSYLEFKYWLDEEHVTLSYASFLSLSMVIGIVNLIIFI